VASLENAVVLLTGASRGIGPRIAEALAGRGAALALTARSGSGLQATADRLRGLGTDTDTLLLPADLSVAAQREELVARVRERFGRIDVLVNNAGIETEGAYVDLPWSAIVENVEVNLLAPMALVHLVLPGMLERRAGHIVNIASIAAKSGAPYAATYSGTKAALAEWSRALRLELRGTGVRLSTLFPGYVREVGMFARFGMTPPFLIGSCAPSRVARAVLRAIERGRAEQIVNSRPLRYAFALNELLPPLGDWLMRVSGLVAFQRRKVGR
jgi:short-subunit dehydrogenase